MVELIGKRYGQALFELALESGDLAARGEEIRVLSEALKEDPDFLEMLNHPKLSKEDKLGMVKSILEGKASDDLIGFMILAVEKNRQEYILKILDYTLEKIEEFNGFVTAYVTSAVKLSDADTASIMEKLQAQTGKKITLETTVDKGIIGGLIIRINDRIVDNSIKRNLHRMALDVYEAKV